MRVISGETMVFLTPISLCIFYSTRFLDGGVEHLVFTGSSLFQGRGWLDQIANCCFAQGTNAWTDVDHTVSVWLKSLI